MADRQRYRFTSRSVALTRLQWSIVGVAVIVGLVGLVLAVEGTVLGAGLVGAAGVTMAMTVLLAQGGSPRH